jgi:diadenosine tetraphosphate (Ap4A) HIT family hydrolase
MGSGWAVLGASQLLPGYSLLCPDPVVDSLNDLDEAGRTAFLLDMARLGDAVRRVCRPLRLNYAMLGNLEPALHAHVIPRYGWEAAERVTKSIWNYPPEEWDSAAYAFDAARHGGLLGALREGVEKA